MKTALIISSFVGASHVGASASAFCLRRLGVETCVLPTTLFGRHPGWGDPGGAITDPERLRDMWAGIHAQGIAFDAVMTGYLGDIDHVILAADIILSIKEQNPQADILIDPVMGDHGRLYIAPETAQAIKEHLLPLAHVTTPNLWELSYLADVKPDNMQSIARCAADTLPCDSLITSVPIGDKIGALWIDSAQSVYVAHQRFDRVPHGGGDIMAATLLAHRLNGDGPKQAMARAAASTFAIIKVAKSDKDNRFRGELPLINQQDSLLTSTPLPVVPL